jgi:hypothetical protein
MEACRSVPTAVDLRRSDTYYETKGAVFGALIETIDLGQLPPDADPRARSRHRQCDHRDQEYQMSIAEQEDLPTIFAMMFGRAARVIVGARRNRRHHGVRLRTV